MFEQFGDVIPRFYAYETLFPSRPQLIQSLSNAYLDVAKFCTSTKAVFQKASKSGSSPPEHRTLNSITFAGINARIIFKIAWKSIEQQHGTLLKEFGRHRKSVEKDAELAHFLEAEKARAVGREHMNQQDKQKSGTEYHFRVNHISLTFVAETERIRLLSLLSSVQWKQQHRRILDMKYPGTGTWILSKDVFEQWRQAKGTHEQQPLWCYGIRKSV